MDKKEYLTLTELNDLVEICDTNFDTYDLMINRANLKSVVDFLESLSELLMINLKRQHEDLKSKNEEELKNLVVISKNINKQLTYVSSLSDVVIKRAE